MRMNATHKQGDMSSIRSNTLSTNQTRSRGSTGPPELPNRLKTCHDPHTLHGGPPSSVQTKNWAIWPPFLVDRPTRSADHRSVRLGLIFHMEVPQSMPKAVQGVTGSILQPRRPWHPSINSRRGLQMKTSTKCSLKPPLALELC